MGSVCAQDASAAGLPVCGSEVLPVLRDWTFAPGGWACSMESHKTCQPDMDGVSKRGSAWAIR